jgi:hypothetical protein
MRFSEALIDNSPEIVRCKDCNLPGEMKYVRKASDGGIAFPPMFYFDHMGKKCLKVEKKVIFKDNRLNRFMELAA